MRISDWSSDVCSSDLTAFGVPGAACATPGLYAPSGPRGTTRFSENQLMYNQTDLKAVFNTGGQIYATTGSTFLVASSAADGTIEIARTPGTKIGRAHV